MSGFIKGLTRGGEEWTPEFVTAVDATTCIGCGRCYKVCSRDVFNLVDKADLIDDDDFEDDEDDAMMVMTVANADDCIGCGACSRVCPKNCHSHAAMSA